MVALVVLAVRTLAVLESLADLVVLILVGSLVGVTLDVFLAERVGMRVVSMFTNMTVLRESL